MARVGGILSVQIDGEIQMAKGDYSYNYGGEKLEAVASNGKVHGFKTSTKVPFIEGAITDSSDLDVPALLALEDVTVTLALKNGKVLSLTEASQVNEGTVTTAEGEIPVRFEGTSLDEV